MAKVLTRPLCVMALLLVGYAPTESFCQTQPKDYPAEVDAARREVIETRDFRIEGIDLGAVTLGKNIFTARMKNKTSSPLAVGLDLATQPGLWLRKRFQKQFIFRFSPGEEKRIEASYEFLRMTPEAYLSIGFGVPTVKDTGAFEIKDFFFQKKYHVGRGNKAIDYDASNFNRYETEHFEIYCYKGSLAERELGGITRMRESAFREISALLQVTYDRKIRLVFYPDHETKKSDIGHVGDGYAFANNIVEVYNEKTKLDPFHELAHILAGRLGSPPAMFNEGFAVYVSERLGADALKYLGSPGKTIDQATRGFLAEGKLISLGELLKFTEIGSEQSRWPISYPEAASAVKFLIEAHGIWKFRRAYQRLQNSAERSSALKNEEVIGEIYGENLPSLERQWLKKIGRR